MNEIFLNVTDDDDVRSQDLTQANIQLLIVDDQHFVRKMLEHSLSSQSDFQIIGTASCGKETLEMLETLQPDIALIDIEMPDIDGLALTRMIAESYPKTKVLVLSIHDEEDYIRHALKSGAKGYLLKTTPPEELAHAIRFIQRGYLQLSPGLFEKLEYSPSETPELSVNALSSELSAPISPSQQLSSVAIRETQPVEPESQEWTEVTQEFVNAFPRLWSRGLVYILFAIILGIVPWSYFSKFDEVIVAQGSLQPRGQPIRLDASVEGKVVELFVTEGAQVVKGQPLLEIESKQIENLLRQEEAKLAGQQTQLSQLELLKNQVLNSIAVQSQQNYAQSLEKKTKVSQAQQQLNSSQISAPLKASEKFAQVQQAEAAVTAARSKLKLSKQSVQAERGEVDRFTRLQKSGAVSGLQVVEANRRYQEALALKTESESALQQAEKRLIEQKRSYDALSQELESASVQAEILVKEQRVGAESLRYSGQLAILKSNEQLKDIESRLTDVASQIQLTQGQIKDLKRQQAARRIYAPESGTIFELGIQNPGAVVRPGEMVAKLAPQNVNLILRGEIQNKDIGFLKVGLPSNLKLDAYPFQEFGIISGKLRWISPDASASSNSLGQQPLPSGSNSQFTVEIDLDQSYIQAPQGRIQLKAGQTAKAEIVVRQRRIIDYFLDPFRKLKAPNAPERKQMSPTSRHS